MTIEDSSKSQSELLDYLTELSSKILEEDSDGLDDEIEKLRAIYLPDFRHQYSRFFLLIKNVQEQNFEAVDTLGRNIEIVVKKLDKNLETGTYPENKDEYEKLKNSLIKLNDHIALEIIRIQYNTAEDQKIMVIQSNIIGIESNINDYRNELTAGTKQIEEAKLEASHLRTELITVLGIFSAIVITFSGGMGFVNNALSSMDEPIIKSTYYILLCGIVLFNVVYLLMCMIGKLGGSKNFFVRYVVWANGIVILILIVLFFVMVFCEKLGIGVLPNPLTP